MQRRIAYPIIAVITFSLGVGLIHLCAFVQSKLIESSELHEHFILLAPPPVRPRFAPTFRACKPGWVQGYVSSDDEAFSESGNQYPSPAKATQELQKWLQEAEHIVERTPRLDTKGKKIGERVVAIFPPNDKGVKWAAIIWTDKSFLRSIEAPSLQLALEFESTKQNQ
ncbi:MAG: hypothetical protein HY231_18970 [Acidobacteria bacterium]|nr:hypothetical protein [Acidobacteriota bacterium]